MNGFELFEQLMADSGELVQLGNPGAGEQQFWMSRDVDPEAVTRWCVEQTQEDLDAFARGRDVIGQKLEHPPEVIIPALIAAAYNMGLVTGVRLRERVQA